jgi:hypothetical protein
VAVDVSVHGRAADSDRDRVLLVQSLEHNSALVGTSKDQVRLDKEGLYALQKAVNSVIAETA